MSGGIQNGPKWLDQIEKSRNRLPRTIGDLMSQKRSIELVRSLGVPLVLTTFGAQPKCQD
jgi:hypothetical protein